jgi:hypothetical protein
MILLVGLWLWCSTFRIVIKGTIQVRICLWYKIRLGLGWACIPPEKSEVSLDGCAQPHAAQPHARLPDDPCDGTRKELLMYD